MFCSSSEGFCLEELRGSILFSAGPLIFAVVVVRNGLVMVEKFPGECAELFGRGGYFGV